MLTAEKVDFFSRVEEPEPYFNRWGQSRPKVKAAVPETDMMKMLLKVGLNFLNQVPTRVMVLMQTENYFISTPTPLVVLVSALSPALISALIPALSLYFYLLLCENLKRIQQTII